MLYMIMVKMKIIIDILNNSKLINNNHKFLDIKVLI